MRTVKHEELNGHAIVIVTVYTGLHVEPPSKALNVKEMAFATYDALADEIQGHRLGLNDDP